MHNGYSYFRDARSNGDWSILNEDAPIDNIAHRVMDLVYDTPDLFGDVVKIVLRDLGFPEETGVGGDDSDEEDFWQTAIEKYGVDYTSEMRKRNEIAYISEMHPLHAVYWETLANAWNMVFAQCIASGKFRFTPEFMRQRLLAKQGRIQG